MYENGLDHERHETWCLEADVAQAGQPAEQVDERLDVLRGPSLSPVVGAGRLPAPFLAAASLPRASVRWRCSLTRPPPAPARRSRTGVGRGRAGCRACRTTGPCATAAA